MVEIEDCLVYRMGQAEMKGTLESKNCATNAILHLLT